MITGTQQRLGIIGCPRPGVPASATLIISPVPVIRPDICAKARRNGHLALRAPCSSAAGTTPAWTSEHPGITFRPGPTGRRAGLASGPDVWEVVRAVRSARAAEPELAEDALLALVADNTGTPLRLIRIATRYWASYPDEIDAEIAAASTAEGAAEDAWRRERQLLAG